MNDEETATVADRVTARIWEIDLSLTGSVYVRKVRPAKRTRQQIIRFLERDGMIERFSITQTVPYCGYEQECLPSQAQHTAVSAFFLESCETRFQAHTMLCARDYADVVAKRVKLSAARRHLIWLGTAAFILADKDLRARVRSWNAQAGYGGIETGIANHKPYKRIAAFTDRLLADMQGVGSEIFG